jgi:hypothetical protein
MYTYLYVYKAPRLFMSGKLYWRIKKDGRWTWTAATLQNTALMGEYDPQFACYMEEEEE